MLGCGKRATVGQERDGSLPPCGGGGEGKTGRGPAEWFGWSRGAGKGVPGGRAAESLLVGRGWAVGDRRWVERGPSAAGWAGAWQCIPAGERLCAGEAVLWPGGRLQLICHRRGELVLVGKGAIAAGLGGHLVTEHGQGCGLA